MLLKLTGYCIDQRRVKKETPIDTHRIEEASLNAWPAMRQTLLDGWILRFSKGFTKRSNSIVPLYAPQAVSNESNAAHILAKIRYCENLYAREQLQTVFRLTSINPRISEPLTSLLLERGYREADPSLVLAAAIETGITNLPPQASPDQTQSHKVEFVAIEEWLLAYAALTGMQEPSQSLHRLILKGIGGECGFAVTSIDQQPVACGLVVVEHELAGLFDIFTATDRRRQGIGGALVQGMLNWAQTKGAQQTYLQVVEDNHGAQHLYAQLGFKEVYRYHYLIAP